MRRPAGGTVAITGSVPGLCRLDHHWQGAQDVEPVVADSQCSRLLFTTSDASIAAAVGSAEYTADLMTPEQFHALVARWAGRKAEDLPA